MFRSLRVRLVLWFTLGVVFVIGVFCFVTYRHLYEELHEKQVARSYPEHPDWNLHGNSSNEEVKDIMGELMEAASLFALPFLVLVVLFGYFLAGKSLKPIEQINTQIEAMSSRELGRPIRSSARDIEFRSLTKHLNALFERLGRSFDDIREYAAKVAHELRTPLTLLRLKIEQGEGRIDPDLQDELQEELQRLTHFVDQSLLLARSEQGTVVWSDDQIDCSTLVRELVDDFQLIAGEGERSLEAEVTAGCRVRTDRSHFKGILLGLFSNAVKHGVGPIQVRLSPKSHGRSIHFLLRNQVDPGPKPQTPGLGLGLRVVKALLGVQNGIRMQTHDGRRFYAVRLIMPAV